MPWLCHAQRKLFSLYPCLVALQFFPHCLPRCSLSLSRGEINVLFRAEQSIATLWPPCIYIHCCSSHREASLERAGGHFTSFDMFLQSLNTLWYICCLRITLSQATKPTIFIDSRILLGKWYLEITVCTVSACIPPSTEHVSQNSLTPLAVWKHSLDCCNQY